MNHTSLQRGCTRRCADAAKDLRSLGPGAVWQGPEEAVQERRRRRRTRQADQGPAQRRQLHDLHDLLDEGLDHRRVVLPRQPQRRRVYERLLYGGLGAVDVILHRGPPAFFAAVWSRRCGAAGAGMVWCGTACRCAMKQGSGQGHWAQWPLQRCRAGGPARSSQIRAQRSAAPWGAPAGARPSPLLSFLQL